MLQTREQFMDELAVRCLVCLESDARLGDLDCCHGIVCSACSQKLDRCPNCQRACNWRINVPLMRVCQSVKLSEMSFRTSAILGAKLQVPNLQDSLFDELPQSTQQLLALGVQLADISDTLAERFAAYIITRAQPENRDHLRKAFALGRVQPGFVAALKRILCEHNFLLSSPLDGAARDLLRDIWTASFPSNRARIFASPIKGHPVCAEITVFRSPYRRDLAWLPGSCLPPSLTDRGVPQRTKKGREYQYALDLGQAELVLPNGSTAVCSTRVMLMLLRLPATTVALRQLCGFEPDLHALEAFAKKDGEGVWALK